MIMIIVIILLFWTVIFCLKVWKNKTKLHLNFTTKITFCFLLNKFVFLFLFIKRQDNNWISNVSKTIVARKQTNKPQKQITATTWLSRAQNFKTKKLKAIQFYSQPQFVLFIFSLLLFVTLLWCGQQFWYKLKATNEPIAVKLLFGKLILQFISVVSSIGKLVFVSCL